MMTQMSDLFSGTYARAGAVTGELWLAALLEVEAALTPDVEIPGPDAFDLTELAREGADHASVVVPLAAALRERDERAHEGATSQDILDTAMMLIARRAREAMLLDTSAAADAAFGLAHRYRTTPMQARTLLQPALPTSLGLLFAGWGTATRRASEALAAVPLPVQMGGPVGHRAPDTAERVATALGLDVLPLAWHGDRTPVATLGSALALLAGALGKAATDVTLMDDVREGRPGGSSAMPGKQNPVAAISVLACARRTRGLAATLLAGVADAQLQRPAGAWQAEWGTLSDLLTLTASAAAWGRELLERLAVEPQDIEGDLGASSELIDRALKEGRRD
ncbi:MAG: 3-carboxy-cis,cis-muconate cycloisomerase [Solirubrobacteraceae bacterium]|nr:3-carboxy-cis,cis-muconate cycloisomerase [Solirubrobacteraceae bacterium]